ncbi:MAG: hypothetical protein WD066_08980 [Planctomycetaceae bacterium]
MLRSLVATVNSRSPELPERQINVNPSGLTFSPDAKKVYFGSFWGTTNARYRAGVA